MPNLKFPDFVKSTGYGTGAGLCGWNCRHTVLPFDPKTMTNNLKQYDMEENEEMYLNHQKQRYFERNIRKYKRQAKTIKGALGMVKDVAAHTKLSNTLKRKEMLLRKWNKAYREFSKEKDLRTDYSRTKTA
jgi:hypothetical protein